MFFVPLLAFSDNFYYILVYYPIVCVHFPLFDCSVYDQTSRQAGIKSQNQGAQVSPLHHFSRQDRGFVTPQSSSQSGGYPVEHG